MASGATAFTDRANLLHRPLRQGAARRFTLPAIQDIKTKLRKLIQMISIEIQAIAVID
jgi:hypothetical protein